MKLSGTGILILLAFLMNTENTQGHDDCRNYQVLNDRTRAASIPRGNVLRCDKRDIPYSKWYRFTGSSGNQMPTKVVPTNRCGTHAPGWLSSPHPTRIGQVVNGKVCFHWKGNSCRWSNNIQIKMCNGYYIYKLGRTPCCYLRYCGDAGFTSDPCSHYTQLSDRERAAGIHRGNILKCDKGGTFDSPKWYRFTGAAGSQMPTSCVSKDHCGTHAPGWLSGPHPTRVGEIVNAKVCFHWSSSCCNWNAIIQIKRCNGFYVYKLMKTPACSLRFCGNAGFDPCKTLKPCQNGATCVNNNGNYSCLCKPGYNGKNCEQVFDACKHFTTLSDKQRAAGVHRGNFLRCDQKDLAPNWYRFTGEAGTQMPTSCVPKHYCGTHAPGWMAGAHPKRVGEIVNATVCFHWSTSCCNWNANIQIKRCNGFYVYKFVKTPVCWLRYCGNKNFDPCKARTPCQNGASCVNNNSDYTCICKSGYKGKNCEQDINECLTTPCRNGGTCENLAGSYKCKCKDGFLGRHCEIVFDACKQYTTLSDKQRAAGVHRGNFLRCDQKDLAPNWYRFTGEAGTQMPTSCVPKHYCGTHAPGWLAGAHPKRVGEIVNATVCFHWSTSCCKWNANIQIKRCNGFYVYNLVKTPVCWLRYCGNKNFDPCKARTPCQNGASCVNNNSDYTCICKPGYKGKNCEQDINECLTRPCRNGGTCKNLAGSYKCKCKDGFLGRHCEIVFDACKQYTTLSDKQRAAGVHRGNFLRCDQKDLAPNWYRFTGEAGTQMPTSCVSKHYCGTHAPGWLAGVHPKRVGEIVNATVCFHWSTSCCKWNANIQIKRCNGFYVYNLVKTPVCWLRYCGNKNFDPCKARTPCRNGGSCVNNNSDYTCICKPGYKGKNCEQDVNECITRPCFNGGTCQNLFGSYSCICKPGFTGKRCENAIDGCVVHKVLREKNRAANYTGALADCDQNALKTPAWYRFSGSAGDKMADSCVKQSHCGTHATGWLNGDLPLNAGQTVERTVCFHWLSSCCNWSVKIKVKKCSGNYFVYELQRPPACNLRYCGNKGLAINECAILKPCKNGSTCYDLPIGYRCQCRIGFQGKNCDIDINECLTNNPCKNGSTCVNNIGGYQCLCVPGYTGLHCDQDINECLTNNPCKNGSTCVNNIGGYQCLCVPGYTGLHCDQDINECLANNPCKNGSTCVNNIGGYQCLCVPGYTGLHCDQDINECLTNNPCKNGSTCVNNIGGYQCLCVPGYTGLHCDQDINECLTNNPCKNGSTCVNNIGGYQCLCVPGYTGLHCDQDINECLTNNPCKNGSTCVNNIGGYQCLCVPGYTGLHCDQDINECLTNNPCKNGSTCVNNIGGYQCLCVPGYTGFHCDQDINECLANNPCKNGSTCVNNIGGYQCLCVPGYTGLHCDQDINECLTNNPCKNGSTCVNNIGGYQCLCVPGYTGLHCDQDINECLTNNPCKNGSTCVNNIGGYQCLCVPGYTGLHCDQDINECLTNNPCKNGSTCVNNIGGYQCLCVPGYTGLHCDQDINECLANNPCKNGSTCVNNIGGYQCLCVPGYTGLHCDQDINECLTNNPCKNGSTCVNNIGGYQCLCVPGYTGLHCDQDVDECNSIGPCKNGGICVNKPGSYECQCLSGYQGNHCQSDINECLTNNPCKNGSTCVNNIGAYMCLCVPGTTGLHCHLDVDECNPIGPCKNGGICINKPGSYECQCLSGYQGNHCENDVDECSYNPCKNGGTCSNTVGNYSCACYIGFDGKNCEKDVDECKSTPCKNGATCVNVCGSFRCDCTAAFTGRLCDKDIDECSANPCQNSGNCSNTVGDYTCKCIKGFEGKHCQNDTNECKPNNPCKNGGACQNLKGTYKCICVNNYTGFNCQTKKQFQPLGCFKDKRNDRAMDKMLKNLRKNIDWSDISKIIQMCSRIARGYSKPDMPNVRYFAIQYYGECWGGSADAYYDKHGRAPDDACWNGVGSANINFVYELL
ncbi:neurogenic locus Notch protein-like isoform X3 [Montipora capricornis]|uniref:neurogenic locus Notch protein-like isoform X3 n=1 Tax=Montipora capricornis TaxID=246305 RepID=UPI0035F14F54